MNKIKITSVLFLFALFFLYTPFFNSQKAFASLNTTDKTSNGNNLTNHNGATEYTTDLPFAQSKSAVSLLHQVVSIYQPLIVLVWISPAI